VALLFPDVEKVRALEAGLSSGDGDIRELLSSGPLVEQTRERVEEINARLHHCERVERFVFLDHPAGVETGELTPTLKLRRFFIEQRYADLIAGMYASIRGWK
jgi:long-chain acyl-CoA synthetase